MLFILGLTGAVLTAIIVVYMFYQWWFAGEPALSWKNFFLLGYLQFYTGSVLHWSITQWQSPVYIPRGEVYGTLAATMVVFLIGYLLFHRVGFRAVWAIKILPQVRMPMTTSAFLVCAIALAFTGLAVTFGIRGGSIGDSLLAQMRVPLMSAAAGCATVLVAANPKNFVWWAVLIPIMVLGLVVATIGTIDRRNFLSVMFVVAWVWYYLSLRYQPRPKMLVKLAVVGAIFFMALATYNAGRHYKNFGADFNDRLEQFKGLASEGPNLSSKNVVEGILLQDTHVCTQAIMENYGAGSGGAAWPFLPMHGVLYYFGNPIPRIIWPSKPEALGIILQRQLDVPANLGVGCIGHGWAELGWIGVLYYAVGLGFICGVADRAVRMRADNPFFMIAIGCSLGNVLGLARGEVSLFGVLITVGFVVTTTVFFFSNLVLRAYMLVGKPVYVDGRTLDLPVDSWTGFPLVTEDAYDTPANDDGYEYTEYGDYGGGASDGTGSPPPRHAPPYTPNAA